MTPEHDHPASLAASLTAEPVSAPVSEDVPAAPSPPRTFWQRLRFRAITATPGIIVNNSSNVIGMTQLVAEAQMFKAGGVDFIQHPNGNILHDYLLEPPRNILKSVFGKAKIETKVKDLFNPKFLKEELLNFNNLERATLLDGANHSKQLINRFSSRSGFSGMTAMAVATLFPDEKDTAEATLANATLAKENPLLYAATRVGQAVWFPAEAVIRMGKRIANPTVDQHVGEHKRQFSGLGMMSAGIFSFISGFRQVEGKWLKEPQYYMRNPWQMAGGLITTVAGIFLMMGIDNRQGWMQFGTTQLTRIATLPGSIGTRFKKGSHGGKEQGAAWYLGAQLTMQVKNVIASLFGGAEKREDGTIVDHKEILAEAQREATVKVAAERKATGLAKDEAVADQPVLPTTLTRGDASSNVAPSEITAIENQTINGAAQTDRPREDKTALPKMFDSQPSPRTLVSKITPDRRIESPLAEVAV